MMPIRLFQNRRIVVSNSKTYLFGTYNAVYGKRLQAYLDVFAYQLSRGFWKTESPNRLLSLAVNHRHINFQPLIVHGAQLFRLCIS